MRIKNLVVSIKMPKKYDMPIHIASLLLVVFGTLMIISTNVGNATGGVMDIVKVMIKQSIFIIVSYLLLTFFANNFNMGRAKKALPIVGILIMVALIATQFSKEVYGSKAWIRFAIAGQIVTIQPSEFAKVFIIVVMAVYVAIAGNNRWNFMRIMQWPFIYFFMCLIPIILQKDIGSMLVFVMISVLCFLIPSNRGLRKQQKIIRILIMIGCVGALVLMSDIGVKLFSSIQPLSHIAVRIENAANPFTDPFNNGYQTINGLYGIARGGLKGVGLGNSIQKYGYLTQSDNDFILAIIIEELGLFGFLFIVLCYLTIIRQLFYYAKHTVNEGYKIILFGTASYIFIHFILNVGGVGGLIPLTGVPLLFISSGGSSLMAIMSAIGISQAVISRIRRQGAIRKVKRVKKKEPQGDRVL